MRTLFISFSSETRKREIIKLENNLTSPLRIINGNRQLIAVLDNQEIDENDLSFTKNKNFFILHHLKQTNQMKNLIKKYSTRSYHDKHEDHAKFYNVAATLINGSDINEGKFDTDIFDNLFNGLDQTLDPYKKIQLSQILRLLHRLNKNNQEIGKVEIKGLTKLKPLLKSSDFRSLFKKYNSSDKTIEDLENLRINLLNFVHHA